MEPRSSQGVGGSATHLSFLGVGPTSWDDDSTRGANPRERCFEFFWLVPNKGKLWCFFINFVKRKLGDGGGVFLFLFGDH